MAQPKRRPRRQRNQPNPVRLPVDPDKALTWADAVETFLGKQKGKNFSKTTTNHYRWMLLGPRSSAFRTDHGVESPGDFTADLLDDFKGELLAEGLSVTTVHGFHRTHKTFLRFCLKADDAELRAGRAARYGVEDGILDAEAPILPKDVEPETFTELEEKKLLAAAAKNPRDRMLVEFLLHTGLRLAEVCAVTVDDIKLTPDGGYVEVQQGKGKKDRWVPMDTPGYNLSDKVARYIRTVRDKKTEDRHLFLGSRKKAGCDEYTGLQPRAVQMILRRLSEEAGVEAANPHKFRHTWGTRGAASGLNPLFLQRAMGHSTLAMTNRYVHASKEDMLKAWSHRTD
jgi:site-specific recombinase XerD